MSGAANSIIRSDMPHSTVNIKIDRDGGVVVYTGASDIGQGSDTMIAADRGGDSGLLARARASDCGRYRPHANRHRLLLQPRHIHEWQCHAAGRAEVKKQIAAAAAKKMDCAPEDLVFRDDLVITARQASPGCPMSRRRRVTVLRCRSRRSVSGRVEGQILRGSLAAKAQRRRAERFDEL